jgi:RNA polymerase sigma-70 factor (ECF subfamily)
MNERGKQSGDAEEQLQPPDEELVTLAQKGDHGAFGQLVQRHQGKIYGLVYNMTSNKQDAEDMVQEIFLKAHKALPRFKGRSSFYTWLYRIAVNRTINFLKKRKKRQAFSLDDMDAGVERDPAYVEMTGHEGPRRDARISELQERLNEALQKLSDKHRTVVVLHDIQGVPHEEIAKMLGCSSGTVRSRLFSARQRLQAELKDYAP